MTGETTLLVYLAGMLITIAVMLVVVERSESRADPGMALVVLVMAGLWPLTWVSWAVVAVVSRVRRRRR